jgi:hypothetical protein
VAFRGSQTPYPQKRQQTLGTTLKSLWKTAESRVISAFAGCETDKTTIRSFFDQSTESHDL